MAKKANLLQFKSQFDNFEDFAHTVHGWGFDFHQLDRGDFRAEVLQIGSPHFLISEGRFNRKLIQKGSPPEGMRTFVIMAENATPFIWRKQGVTQNSFLIFPKGSELDAASVEGFHVFTISISERILSERLKLEDHLGLRLKLQQGGAFEDSPENVEGLRQFIRRLTTEVENYTCPIHLHNFQKSFCCELVDHIFNILAEGNEQVVTLPFQKRSRLIQNIEAWLEEASKEPHTVGDLCRNFQVNERTLRRVFGEWYGVSPHQYLLAVRLNGVRKELCHANPSATRINEIANNWGFWHMGQLAATYRRHFGELPSETLSKSNSK